MKTLPLLLVSILLVSVVAIFATAAAEATNTMNYPSGQPEQPIVGILSQPNRHSWNNLCGQYVQQTYVDFASVGVRAVPIPYDISPADLQTLLGHLNGALFTGGGLDFAKEHQFYNTAKAVYNYATETAKKEPSEWKIRLVGNLSRFPTYFCHCFWR